MPRSISDHFRDLLDHDLDDMRFVFWNILPTASPVRLSLMKQAIEEGTWAGRIMIDELGRILYGHDDYRACRAARKPPRNVVHVRVGDRCTRAEVEGLIRRLRYFDGGMATREERQEAVRHQLHITPHLDRGDILPLLGVDRIASQARQEGPDEAGELLRFLFPAGWEKTHGLPMLFSRNLKQARRNAARLADARNLYGNGHSPGDLRRQDATHDRGRPAIRFNVRRGRAEVFAAVLRQVGRPDAGPRPVYVVAHWNKNAREVLQRGEPVLIVPCLPDEAGVAAGGRPAGGLARRRHSPDLAQQRIWFLVGEGRAEIVSPVLRQVDQPDGEPRPLRVVAKWNKTKEAAGRGEIVLVVPFIDERVVL